MSLPTRLCARARPVTAVASTVVVLALAGCTDDPPEHPAASSSPRPATTSPAASAPLDSAACAGPPPTGQVDRGGRDLSFDSGFVRIATTPVSTAPHPAPGPVPTAQMQCYEFPRWGPAQPDVPPDSLLFTFRGTGTDGAQIEFTVGDLTGGVLPPVGGVRPTVGPLTGPINAQIGISLAGTYHHAGVCQLTLTAMGPEHAAGSFRCPTATLSEANPLAPDDDVSYDDDETSPPAPLPPLPSGPGPHLPATPVTVSLTGWFELT